MSHAMTNGPAPSGQPSHNEAPPRTRNRSAFADRLVPPQGGAPAGSAQALGRADHLTVLRTFGKVMAKEWLTDGTIAGYDRAKQYMFGEQKVSNLADLAEVLQDLERRRDMCVIRGAHVGVEVAAQVMPGILAHELVKDPTFKLHDGAVLRNGKLFRDCARHWMMIDVDGFRPALDPVADPLHACLECVASELPAAFQGRGFFWSLSASAGHPSCAGVLKAHLWYWLDQPRTSAELRAWAETVPGIDKSVYNPVQVHYTAAPIIQNDPVPVRSGLYAGPQGDAVDLVIPAAVLSRARQPGGGHARMTDPGDKPGMVGAFCRVFSPMRLLELMSDEFEQGRDDQHFSWIAGEHAPDGVFITECGNGLVSVHNTAPTVQNRRVNVYDFVRLHLFGHLDEVVAEATPVSQLPSTEAMRGWIKENCPEVMQELAEGRPSAEAEFGAAEAVTSPDTVILQLRQLPGDQVAQVWVELVVAMRRDLAAQVVDEVHRLTGIGKRQLNAALRAAREQAARQRRAEEAARRTAGRARQLYQPEDQTQHARAIEDAIVATAAPGEYISFAGVLACVTVKVMPYTHLIDDEDHASPPVPQIEPLDEVAVLSKAEQVVVLYRATKGGEEPMAVPDRVIKILLSKKAHAAPAVSGLVTHPLVLPGGEILTAVGLHERTGLFMSGAEAVEAQPYSQPEAQAALARLRRVFLEGFEFATELDADAAMAGLFTGVQRRALDIAPGLAILAAVQSSGKTTLARRIHITLTGHDMPVTSWAEGDETEVQKRLLAALLRSPAMVCFDNLTDGTTFRSPSVAAAMTGPVLTQRLLGVSRDATCLTNVLFVLTGNNVALGADEVTRWITVRLTSKSPRPHERQFEQPDVLAHALAARAALLRDVIGIIAGYCASATTMTVKTRFPQWDRMVRQPLIWAGGADIADVFSANAEGSEDLQGYQLLVETLHEEFEAKEFTAGDVVRAASFTNFGFDGLDDEPASSDRPPTPGQLRAERIQRLRAVLGTLRTKSLDSEASVGRALRAAVGRPARIGDEGAEYVQLKRRVVKGLSRYSVTGLQ
ncbi:hypothetical protein RA210_U10576 [Rubrivivax sp. A210]|uniref:hypothetical protein n=1 Tax=Rubrivivax sp. A210 TaxID=2772301 RepID=UPI00191ABCC9|nr:hypothetical protein [Rubrivivax sp. A210]CAD5366939.1 hypothetical protein RA210_U10576 [Rubrivivax sp. A210]